ncbi:DUF6332 family protein [Streptomyces endophyticus]|uniref:DUF6332 family protein n=1 Tax=Streptomyces endophyticus TaxID=714166 RepID=A0ABU6FHF9_9ACTN|nr:DUF6332 family protein [Streptomyces endophyticus]MEB8343478.1 DUF6332 family protein [Streptomyces endophyticus]
MGAGRESRVEKDAMTVEIVYALVSGAVIGAVVTLVAVAILTVPLTPYGAALGGLVGVAHIVRVLRRFDRERRLGR